MIYLISFLLLYVTARYEICIFAVTTYTKIFPDAFSSFYEWEIKSPYLAIDHISTSRKHLRTKVTPDFHLTYRKNVGNLGSESN